MRPCGFITSAELQLPGQVEQLKAHLRPVGRNSRGADQPAPDARGTRGRITSEIAEPLQLWCPVMRAVVTVTWSGLSVAARAPLRGSRTDERKGVPHQA